MTEHNLPEPDDAPWLNLTQEEINQLRYDKQKLTDYGREKLIGLGSKYYLFLLLFLLLDLLKELLNFL